MPVPTPASPPAPPTTLVSTAEAAARLGLTPAGVRSRVRRGALRARRDDSGRRLLVELPAAPVVSALARLAQALERLVAGFRVMPWDAGRPRSRGPGGGQLDGRGGPSSPAALVVPLAGAVVAGLAVGWALDTLRRRREGPNPVTRRG